MSIKYTYRILFWLGVLITLFGFIHFVKTIDFMIVLFGFMYLFSTLEFYETYEDDIRDGDRYEDRYEDFDENLAD